MPTESLAQLQGKLGRVIQFDHESVVVYGTRVRQLMLTIFKNYSRNGGTQIGFKTDTEQEAIRCFARGLKKGIYVSPHRCDSLDTAIRDAINSEADKEARGELRAKMTLPPQNNFTRKTRDPKLHILTEEKFCQFCKRTNHTEDKCFKKHGYPNKVEICAFCKK